MGAHDETNRRGRARRPLGEIALIGAMGRVGRPLCRMLASADLPFRVLTRDPARAPRFLGSKARMIDTCLTDPFAVEEALVGVETLVLLDGLPELERAPVRAAERAGVRHVVKLSPLGEAGEAAPEHRTVECEIESSGLAWTMLRATPYMQTLAELVERTTQEGVLWLPMDDAAVAWIDCRDVAAVILRVMLEPNHEGRAYVVTGPEALGGDEVSERLAEALGVPLRYAPIAPEEAEVALRHAGIGHVEARRIVRRCETLRTGALGVVTDVVARIGQIQPRTLSHFAMRHAWPSERPTATPGKGVAARRGMAKRERLGESRAHERSSERIG